MLIRSGKYIYSPKRRDWGIACSPRLVFGG